METAVFQSIRVLTIHPVEADDSLERMFHCDWMREEHHEAQRRASTAGLQGSAAEAFIFDQMTAAAYHLNFLTGQYYFNS